MIAVTVSLLGLAATGLILCWSSWRFGATMPAIIWLRCFLAFPILTACASLTAGWIHAGFVPWWLSATLIGVREEGLKLLFFVILANDDPDTRSSGDRLHAMTAVALGFAVLEAIDKAMPLGAMTRVLPQAYVGFYMGTAVHVFLSIQAAAFLILTRTRSQLWLVGAIVPMALHSIWDSPYLIGVSTPGMTTAVHLAVMAAIVIIALGLAWLVGARATHGAGARGSAGAAMALWLALTTALQVFGKAGWHYGVTITPYAPMVIGWWIVGLDLAIILFRMRGADRLLTPR